MIYCKINYLWNHLYNDNKNFEIVIILPVVDDNYWWYWYLKLRIWINQVSNHLNPNQIIFYGLSRVVFVLVITGAVTPQIKSGSEINGAERSDNDFVSPIREPLKIISIGYRVAKIYNIILWLPFHLFN